MISFLAKIFIKNHKEYSNEKVRVAYGMLCSIVGVFLNLCLFALKLVLGVMSGSIAVTADAFNNLSDAGSSVITLIGFKLASQKPDANHPFGHGRFEYISGLVVSMIIIIMGVELVQSSFDKIVSPQAKTNFTTLSVMILLCSIIVKLYMAFYNKKIGKKISSSAMVATATDSFSDSVATLLVVVSMLISQYFDVEIDGWCGIFVALFIIYAGINAAKDTINPLLGQMPSEEFVHSITDIVMSHEEIVGTHDLVVHDYGPGRIMISLHAEVSDKAQILATHDLIDNIEHELTKKLGCDAVIHIDPIATDDEVVSALKNTVCSLVRRIDESITIHDFRIVEGNTHTNLIFDIVVPFELKLTDERVKQRVSELVGEIGDNYFAVIEVDRQMTKKGDNKSGK